MMHSTAELPRDSEKGQSGGQSRCVKCDDDLTILEVVYEDKDNRLCLEESAERSGL